MWYIRPLDLAYPLSEGLYPFPVTPQRPISTPFPDPWQPLLYPL